MHEMALVKDIVGVVLKECEENNIASVRRVNLLVGEARDFVDDLVGKLFRYLARGTVAENAQVAITKVPLRVSCCDCGEVFLLDVMDADTWRCPQCGAYRHYKLYSGMELAITSIEVGQPEKCGTTGIAMP